MSRWSGKYVIGLTGNIAVGKSVVRQMLQHLGAYTIDADGLAHQAMSPGAPAYKPVLDTFGQIILNPDKTINRAALGNIVFSNEDAMAKLEAITHPIIGQAINTLVSRSKQPIVVIEAIKLLEGSLAESVDTVWVVHASAKSQYIRLVTKRKMSEADAKQRILAQNAQGDKLKQANIVIKNDGNVEETWKQVQAAWRKAQQDAASAESAPAAPQTTTLAAESHTESDDTGVETSGSASSVDTSGVTIRRGMPGNAEAIAAFLNDHTGQSLSRMDVMMSFGEKSYLLASDGEDGDIIGLTGFQVENLITRVDEFYLTNDGSSQPVIHAMIRAVEDASIALQSEVGFFFIDNDADGAIMQSFSENGYEVTTIKEIKIPAWREAVQEINNEGRQILTRKLRKDRVLKPI